MLILLFLAAAVFGFAPSAGATVTYQYTGNPFTKVFPPYTTNDLCRVHSRARHLSPRTFRMPQLRPSPTTLLTAFRRSHQRPPLSSPVLVPIQTATSIGGRSNFPR